MKDYTKSNRAKNHKAFIFFLILSFLFSTLAAGLPAYPVLAQDTTYPVYIVKSGDTLLGIAFKFNTTLEELMRLNNIGPEFMLYPGFILKIPSLPGFSGTLSSENVNLGFSLISVSRRSQISLDQLVHLNRLTSPAELFIGREFLLIDVEEESQSVATALQAKQSFFELALASRVNPWLLSKQNLLSNANHAIPNDTYFVPGDNTKENALIIPGIGTIAIENLPLSQGETYLIQVESFEPIKVEAELLNKTMQFTDLGDGKLVAYGGINALTEAGVYPLSITLRRENGTVYRFDQMVLINSGYYATDPVLQVDPASLDGENIRAENEQFSSLLAPITPIQLWNGVFVPPSQNVICISSAFGNRRSYNNNPEVFYHTGIDFTYCDGTDVYATARGKVVGALPDLIVRGNTIIIDHGLGIYSIYMHLSEMHVQEGDMVEPGQMIGVIGTTGRSTGPHLHFEIDIQGTPVNPATWLKRAFP